MNITDDIGPPWQISEWLNSPQPVTLASLRGRVVVLHAFQMLCPGCVSHGIPQALRIHQLFAREPVTVIGLHTVFEHHEVMGVQALRVFLHEYRVPFPVGIDQAGVRNRMPLTMQAYGMRGTPSVILFDPQGRIRLNHFGKLDDLQMGAVIGRLLAEAQTLVPGHEASVDGGETSLDACAQGLCLVNV